MTSLLAFSSETPPTETVPPRPQPTRSQQEVAELVAGIDSMISRYAYGVCRNGIAEYDDVLQDGRIGAILAAHSWNPEVATYNTHAMHRVIGEIKDGMRRRDVMSRHTRKVLAEDDPRLQGQASLNWLLSADSDTELGDLLPDEDALDPEELAVEAAYLDWQCKEVQFAMRMLSGYERDVIRDYFWGGLTLWQIGERMGFTESRACQIRNAALTTMWRCMSARDELVDN